MATAALSAVIWVALLPPATAIDHAIPFDHSRHTEVACAACHRGAERSARAGIPEMATCLKCHATAPHAALVASDSSRTILPALVASGFSRKIFRRASAQSAEFNSGFVERLKAEATYAAEAKSAATARAEATGSSNSAKSTWDELARGTQSPWAQVTRVPDHVMFSHRRHVTIARLDCASCHGDMRAQRAALGAAPMRLDMSACISCHKTEGATEDCLACHR